MDDIFSNTNEEQDLKKDSNIEWKKSGIDKNERITLKVNVKEANEHNSKKKRDTKKKHKVDKSLVPQGFKKMKKKIRGPLDEDEDEDENDYILVRAFEIDESSLIKVLNPEEKKLLNQRDNLENIRLQENIGKQTAVEQAEKAIKNLGVKLDKKVVAEKMTKHNKVDSKEVLEDSLKKKPVKHNKQKAVEKYKQDKIKTNKTEDKALAQAVRRAEKKAEIEKKKEDAQNIKDVDVKKQVTTTAEKEEKAVKEQEKLHQKPAAKEEQVIKQEEKLEEKAIQEQKKDDKSLKELIMEKRGQKNAETETRTVEQQREENTLSEEDKKRQREEQLIRKYDKER